MPKKITFAQSAFFSKPEEQEEPKKKPAPVTEDEEKDISTDKEKAKEGDKMQVDVMVDPEYVQKLNTKIEKLTALVEKRNEELEVLQAQLKRAEE